MWCKVSQDTQLRNISRCLKFERINIFWIDITCYGYYWVYLIFKCDRIAIIISRIRTRLKVQIVTLKQYWIIDIWEITSSNCCELLSWNVLCFLYHVHEGAYIKFIFSSWIYIYYQFHSSYTELSFWNLVVHALCGSQPSSMPQKTEPNNCMLITMCTTCIYRYTYSYF